MNLHAIVSGQIGAVNPFVPIIIQRSIGYDTSPSGVRTPKYAAPFGVMAQIQALSAEDLSQIDGLNIQGEKRAVYINGRTDGLIRQEKKGGDLINVNLTQPNQFLGFLTADQLTIGQVFFGVIQPGQKVFGAGVVDGTVIIEDVTGNGGAGIYNISPQQTAPGPLLTSVVTETWLNVHVLEYWPDWCKFVITRQDGS